MKLLKLFAFLLFLFVTTTILASSIPINLRCEFWTNPQGIDVPNPVLSWVIKTDSNIRAMRQTAYEVMVASSKELLSNNIGDLWNTGKVQSDRMGQIVYDGKTLLSSQQCWWKVRIWDDKGIESAWSEPSQWSMGVLNANEWNAKWISAIGADKYAHKYKSAKSDFNRKRDLAEFRKYGPKPEDPNFSSMLIRKEFTAHQKAKRAIVHVSGLGQYELFINGSKIGDYILSPGWSFYPKTVLYDTYDVTQQIQLGDNAIGLILGNSIYNIQPDSVRYVKFLNSYGQLKAIVQLRIEYENGSIQTICSDKNWQVSPGPITYSNFYGGEDFDSRLVPKGWSQPSFNADERWSAALECDGPGGTLNGLSCAASPIKAIETLTPVKINKIKPNLWVYDLGQNASIMPEIEIKGLPGAYVRIIPSELLKSDGTVDRKSATQNGVRPAWWQYTISTKETEHWFPQFFYQGGRYLQVELFPAVGDSTLPNIETLKGTVVHSSAEPIGNFSCSNELFNRIYSLVRWAQRSNMMSILTDCPQREKQSWLEQYHLNGPSLRYNFDLLSTFRKGMNDMADCQVNNGLIPCIAPAFFVAGKEVIDNPMFNSTEWGSAFIIAPWQQYLFSGDVSLLNRYYGNMKRYVAFLDSTAKNNIITIGLGDWYDIGPKPAWGSQLTPIEFTGTAIYFYDNQIMAQIAAILGKTNDAKYYKQRTEAIRHSFNKAFYKPEKGIYATGSNTTLAMPLFLNIAEPENRTTLIDSLVADIRHHGNAFTSGEVGFRFLLGALAMENHSNVIYDMNNQTERPGYGYQLKKGATSLTEKWDAGVGSFGSQNHFMSGQINEWFFHDLLGIGVDADGAGFRKSIIKPSPVGDLKWVKGSYKTVSGLIEVEWTRENNQFSLNVTIPANTLATIYIPAVKEKDVIENGKRAAKSEGIKFLRMEKGTAIYDVGSGVYKFISKMN
jgi:hypothetical protein